MDIVYARRLVRLRAVLPFLAVLLGCSASNGNSGPDEMVEREVAMGQTAPVMTADETAALEELAELERTGGFVPGLGLAESNLREGAGDYAGAVLAVFKELSWAYGRGEGGVGKEEIAAGLEKIRGLETGPGAAMAADAAEAFFQGRWETAEDRLTGLYQKSEVETENDGFSRWMLLVCLLETGKGKAETRSAYSSMRARYAGFPEYWYRGARYFSGAGIRSSLSWAERCINLAPFGPYAAECREIMAEAAGLDRQDGAAIKTQTEIEALVTAAVQANRPEKLEDLLPLVALPDNPYTLYASGALRAIAAMENFRLWFNREAAKSKGRLAERLLFISRG
jgi:hypothetical protein